ncbi:MFS transporter [Snodgrassella sp. CFCC 13594]|uniref:MFS transporter n=1 Tax=Snodgrassella sp. CFCC 13594 TaxID=1775559 RepID=UPI0009ED26A0|nr:MFS transporter [Snodgrassella sp. CFCC 13594]
MVSNNYLKAFYLALAVLLFAVNLRAPIVGLGPLVFFIEHDLHINTAVMGLLTTLPVLCFAVFSPTAPTLARRFGIEIVLIWALMALLVGLQIRAHFLSLNGLLLGTLLLSMGITMGNVLLPIVVKIGFPLRVGWMIGGFSAVMSLAAGLASGVAVPMAQKSGWPTALGVWFWPTLLALVAWLVVRLVSGRLNPSLPAVQSAKLARNSVPVWCSPIAWAISFYMGLQSLLYYTLAAWLPAILVSKGVAPSEAGWYGSVLQWVALPCLFVVGALAEKCSQQRLALAMALCCVLGVSGLITLPLPWLIWCTALLGIGAAGVFVLSLVFFNVRTDSAGEAVRLSAMAQTVGYLVAALGPWGAGWLYQHVHSWQWPLAVLMGLSLVMCVCGWFGGQPLTLQQWRQRKETAHI